MNIDVSGDWRWIDCNNRWHQFVRRDGESVTVIDRHTRFFVRPEPKPERTSSRIPARYILLSTSHQIPKSKGHLYSDSKLIEMKASHSSCKY
jgi:hypothetical protein